MNNLGLTKLQVKRRAYYQFLQILLPQLHQRIIKYAEQFNIRLILQLLASQEFPINFVSILNVQLFQNTIGRMFSCFLSLNVIE